MVNLFLITNSPLKNAVEITEQSYAKKKKRKKKKLKFYLTSYNINSTDHSSKYKIL